MNPAEVQAATAYIVGLWSQPEMADPEARALGAELARATKAEVHRVAQGFIAAGRDRRPVVAEWAKALRALRWRDAPAGPHELPPAPEQWASGAEWLARAREALVQATTPYRKPPTPPAQGAQ